MNEIHLTKKDFKLDWYSGSGAGGQKRNKSKSYCRITHIESGLTAQGSDHKSPLANQKDAFEKLAKMVISYYNTTEVKERFNSTETIRNYHAVRNEVHDKASGLKMSYKEIVLDGDLAPMIKARAEVKGASND